MSESYIGGKLCLQEKQAQSTREKSSSMREQNLRELSRVISITSGKGGVGKTTTVVNLAIALANLDKKVLIFDADLGLANVHVHIGSQPEYTLQHVFEGKRSLSEVIIQGPNGINIIPATSGVQEMLTLNSERQLLLLSAIENLPERYDYLLIDTQAGIGSDVIYFNSVSNEIICVINDEPTSLTDAYALIKILTTKYGEKEVGVLVNDVADERTAQQTFQRLARAVQRFLRIDLKFKGFVPSDPLVLSSIRAQSPVASEHPSSPAARAFSRIADNLEQDFYGHRIKGGLQFFFKQIIEGQNYERANS